MPIERNLARAAVHDANLAGADKMAVEEFHEAGLALKKGEALLKEGDQEAAIVTLDVAITKAHQAEVTAYIRTLNLAENRIRQLESQKNTLLKAWRAAIADHEASIDFTNEEESQPNNIPTSYTVTEGENLFAIASRKKIYGDPLLWPLIYKANRDQIKNPQQIYPGQRLTIPRGVTDLEMEEARNTARESTIFSPGTTKEKSN
jgi:nucleoid-associated protein YgaU